MQNQTNPQGRTRLTRSLVLIMAAATGLAVANNYYAQPLLPFIGRDLHLSVTAAGLIVTVAQIGYALGLVFLLPLGDLLERRRMIVLMATGTAVALIGFGIAPTGATLLPAALLVGTLSVLAQVLVPFAAGLAEESERGRIVGTVMSGLLIGVLLARTAAGYIAQTGSWRTVYFVACGAMILLAVVLARTLPHYRENVRLRYGALLRSVVSLVRSEPVLRLRAVYGALSFGAFSVLWTSIGFLLAGPPYHYQSGTIGLFGLAGAAGALSASFAGRLADRGLARITTGLVAVLLALAWVPLGMGQNSLAALLVGIVVLDVAAQGMHITNQSEIYRLRPEARSRINSAYMTTYFMGGAVGSAASAAAFERFGWIGVAACGAAFGIAAVIVWLVSFITSAVERQ